MAAARGTAAAETGIAAGAAATGIDAGGKGRRPADRQAVVQEHWGDEEGALNAAKDVGRQLTSATGSSPGALRSARKDWIVEEYEKSEPGDHRGSPVRHLSDALRRFPAAKRDEAYAYVRAKVAASERDAEVRQKIDKLTPEQRARALAFIEGEQVPDPEPVKIQRTSVD